MQWMEGWAARRLHHSWHDWQPSPLAIILPRVLGTAPPVSCNRKALLRARGIETCTLATIRPGHASELALELATQGARTILLIGGDGTVSEVANGIVHLPKEERPVLGILPGGTGNDFLRDFGIFDLKGAAEAIASGRTTAVDVVEANWQGGRRFFVNVLGTGLMARAGDRRNRQFKWVGRRGYDIAALVELLGMKATPTRMVLDGNRRDGSYPLCGSVACPRWCLNS